MKKLTRKTAPGQLTDRAFGQNRKCLAGPSLFIEPLRDKEFLFSIRSGPTKFRSFSCNSLNIVEQIIMTVVVAFTSFYKTIKVVVVSL